MKLTKEEKAILLRALQKARLHTPKMSEQERNKMLRLEQRLSEVKPE